MNTTRKNRAPFYARPDNMLAEELRLYLVTASESVAERLGGIDVVYLAGENLETKISLWVDADPMPRELRFFLPFAADFKTAVETILAEIAKLPPPTSATS